MCECIHNPVSELFPNCNVLILYQIICRYIKKGYLFTKGYLFLICNSLVFFFSLPIMEILIAVIKDISDNSTKHFPFVALYPESCYHFPIYEVKAQFSDLSKLLSMMTFLLYILFTQVVYFSQIIATSLCGLIILGTDTLIATALFHTCGHFKVLQTKLENIGNEIDLVSIYFTSSSCHWIKMITIDDHKLMIV